MIAALTGAGLSASAGLNAFIPLLMVGLFARFTSLIELPTHLAWLESWPVIIVAAVFLFGEVVIDKIPGVDHINDLIQSAVRPLVGGVIFAATSAADAADQSSFWSERPLVGGVLGAIIAMAVHLAKATARPAINAATGGTGAPLASFAEDATSVGFSLVAIFIPIMVIALIIALALVFYRIVTSGRRRRRRRALREAEQRAQRNALAKATGKSAWWRIRTRAD